VAKKPRTPPPPRKVQAPKQRHDSKGSDPERQKKILYGIAAAGLIGLIVALIVVFAGGKTKDASASDDKAVAAAMAAAGCTFVSKPVLPPKSKAASGFHADVPTLTTKVKWSTFPTSGGAHYGQYAIWGFYTDPVNPRQVGHNLEHGGVVLWWGPKTPSKTVDALRAIYDDSPNSMFGTPIDGLGTKVAISAWTGDPSRYYQDGYYGVGHLGTCTTWNDKTEAAFKKFRDAYRAHGPEGVPASANNPGS
jgi:hypothetical protein